MVKVRFKQDRVVQDGLQGTAHETRFAAGDVVDLAEASANHWLSRGVAERVLETEEPAMPPTGAATPGDDLFSDRGAAEPDSDTPAEGDNGEQAEAGPPSTEPNGGKKRGGARAAKV
jgi:hypothetical protein